mgnify:CR=1 FL=1
MKKIIKYLPAILLMFSLMITSCEDELEQLPPEQLSNELSLGTYDNLVLATNGSYTQLGATNWYGRDFTVIADLKGGNAKSSPLNSGRFQTEYNWANSQSESAALFDNAYSLISRANNVINALVDFEETGVTQAQLDQLDGEAKFLRALAYFDLVRMYAQPYSYDPSSLGVPIVTVTEIASPARNTVQEVYTQIVADLLDAENKIGALSADGFRGETNRVSLATKEAVQALLAKVYLYMEDWSGASTYASKVIGSNKYSLYSASEYGNIWSTDGASEVIFEVYGSSTETAW